MRQHSLVDHNFLVVYKIATELSFHYSENTLIFVFSFAQWKLIFRKLKLPAKTTWFVGPTVFCTWKQKIVFKYRNQKALGLSNAFSRKSYICRRNQRLMLGFDLRAPSLNWLPTKLVVSISPHWDRMNHVHKRRQRVQFPIMHRSWKIQFPVKNAMNECHKISY